MSNIWKYEIIFFINIGLLEGNISLGIEKNMVKFYFIFFNPFKILLIRKKTNFFLHLYIAPKVCIYNTNEHIINIFNRKNNLQNFFLVSFKMFH